jgi:hypothetical protein
MSQPFFTREQISDFDIYDKNCANTLQLVKNILAEGYPVEFQVIITTPCFLNSCVMFMLFYRI